VASKAKVAASGTTNTVPVDAIITTRRLEPDEDLSKLVEHIKENGMKVPILIDRNNILIDGLRRLEAAHALGLDSVSVVVATDYVVACNAINAAYAYDVAAHRTWRRVWEMYRDTQVLMWDRLSMLRQRTAKERMEDARKAGGETRDLFTVALGLSSRSMLQAVLHVHRLAESDTTPLGDRAREAVILLAEGKVTPYGADGHVKRAPGLSGDMVALEDQRNLLSSVASTLSGIAKGLTKMGPLNPGLSPEELKVWLDSMKASRRILVSFIRNMEEKEK